MMKLLIKFPTRQRPRKFLMVLRKYVRFMRDKANYEVIVSADLDDPTMNNDAMREAIAAIPRTRIFYGRNRTKIEAVNADMEHCKDFDILLLASDDMMPMRVGYDMVLRKKMQAHFPDTDGVLFFNDGYQGKKLNTLSIMGRAFYNRFGYIYHPEYRSFYCDNEFMEVAKTLNKLEYFSEVIIQHQHYTYQRQRPDPLYKRNGKYMAQDKDTFWTRKRRGFDLPQHPGT